MRVVAGEFRGRRLIAPKGQTVRPTSDRVKEALFSMLGPLDGATVLDLYAGTGALGIEAISRGAKSCVFVERSGAALSSLKGNLATLSLASRTKILSVAVGRAASSLASLGPFDRVFVDPPYADVTESIGLLAKLVGAGIVASESVMVVEHASRDAPLDPALDLIERRAFGDTTLSFFSTASTSED